MASYSQPSDKYNGIYNPDYFIGKEDELKLSAVSNAVNTTGDYVKRDGSNVMTGTLTTPGLILFNDGSIYFDDTTHQHTAFTDSHKADVIANTEKLTSLSYSSTDDSTSIMGALKIKKIIFLDDSNSEQSFAFSSAIIADINSSKQKTTGTSYNAGNLKTTIDLLHATTFTTDSFNVTHMTGTTSNVQSQITAVVTDVAPLKNNCQKISYNLETQTTTIANITQVDNLVCNKITFGYHEQTDAFTILEKTKLSWLNIDATELYINQIRYLDDSVQTTAYSTAERSKTQHQSATTLPGNTNLTLFDGKIQTNTLDITKIVFDDTTEQTSAFTSGLNTMLNTVNGKTAFISSYQITNEPPTTVLTGNCGTNFITLYDGFDTQGKITFQDGSFQTSAFSSTKDSLLTTVNSRTRNLTYIDDGLNTTQIAGRITTNRIRLYDGEIVFADGSIQTKGFTDTKNTMLDTVNGKTAFISSFQLTDAPPTTVLAGNCGTNFLTLYDGYSSQGKITFQDGSFQTSAFTNEYKIKVDSMNNIIGSVQIYAGFNDPIGYMICDGRTLLISQYSSLFGVIGQNYIGIKNIDQSFYFCIPDMRNLYVRGNASSNNNTYNFPSTQFSSSLGQFKPMQLQSHKHAYIDRGEGSVRVQKSGTGTDTAVANDSSQNFYTSSETYDGTNIQQNNVETMPNSICMNYIIKY